MKSSTGNFFEDFKLGQKLSHAPARTLSHGDSALYTALYGARFALAASDTFARLIGFHNSPLDDLLVFHTVFGMSVADVSLNAVANLGYAEGHFRKRVHAGATLRAQSKVVGLKENSDGKTGIVYVHTEGFDELDGEVLSYVRWVMVRKRDASAPAPAPQVPKLETSVAAAALFVPAEADFAQTDLTSGSANLWDDYAPGEKIDHMDGVTIEEAEHMMATRLYQNTARVHFNQFTEGKGRFGRRLIYGGHVISLARAISFNGLANAFHVTAINGGRHVNPLFAGDTVFAWSEVLDKTELRKDVGALRLRLVATKNLPCAAFPDKGADGAYPDNVILDFDYWAIVPRR
jgi:2-methylfumaryl-CoA hydratase